MPGKCTCDDTSLRSTELAKKPRYKALKTILAIILVLNSVKRIVCDTSRKQGSEWPTSPQHVALLVKYAPTNITVCKNLSDLLPYKPPGIPSMGPLTPTPAIYLP